MAQFHRIDLPDAAAVPADRAARQAAQERIFAFLRPQPSPAPLIRVGGARDGAYLLPDDLDGITACFSPGVNNIKHFEDELLQRFHIRSHLCDYTSDAARLATPLVADKQTFAKKWLDLPGVPDAITLQDWVDELAPDGSDLLLQMDIEGAEYRNLLHAAPELLRRFRIITLELHGLHRLNDPKALAAVFLPLVDRLGPEFACVHAHPNNCRPACRLEPLGVEVPRVLELTLLRKDRVAAVDPARRHPPQLPHPLDLPLNVRHLPPLFLGPEWYDGPLSPPSRIAQLEAMLQYERESGEAQQRHVASVTRAFALLARATPPPAAEATADPQTRVEVAQGKPFIIPSGGRSAPKRGTVRPAQPYFCHSPVMLAPQITVDLGTPARLVQLVVANRSDGRTDRAAGLMAVLHTDPDPDSGTAYAVPLDADFLAGRRREAVLSLPGTAARFVTLTTPLRTALHFSDLRIHALPEPASRPATPAKGAP